MDSKVVSAVASTVVSTPPSTAERPSIHGHTILRWLAEQPMNPQSLQQRVDSELGGQCHFHTCDTAGLSLEGLLALLAARGKIVQSPGDTWTSDLSKMCADA